MKLLLYFCGVEDLRLVLLPSESGFYRTDQFKKSAPFNLAKPFSC